jgi:antitoxin component YwqK of YwqJK toxin-antitoxin module
VIRLALLGCALCSAANTLAQSYDVVAHCRSGLPNGAYELKMSDGRLRVAGAFAQGRMTGTFIFWTAGGARLAVVPMDNDVRSGTVALWYTGPGGRAEAGHKLEAPFVDGRPHGVKRSWYPSGQPRTETRYEHGELAEARAWSARGQPLSEEAARKLAARDADSDERTYDSLIALVRGHLPICEAATPEPAAPAAEPSRS